MITIPQSNPKAGYLAHQVEIDAAIQNVLASGWYILGKESESFEAEYAAYFGLNHAIGVGSGTEALALALRACGIGAGDVVLTVSHTAVATVAAIEWIGATAAFVDIEPDTFTMDVSCLEPAIQALNGRVKAIVPVHIYGHPVDMPAVMEIARMYNLYVIEDCAQSHGAMINGQKAGTFGHIAAFSFYPTKNLGALGDGGAVATNDPMLAEQVRLLRQYGWRERYISDIAGTNSRLDELQAAVLRVKLRYLDQDNARRREIAAQYNQHLTGSQLTLPSAKPNVEHVYHLYVVRTLQRDQLKKALQEEGIGTLIHYPQPIHLQPAYQGRIYGGDALPNTEQAAREVLSLPIFPELTDEQVATVIEKIREWQG